MSDNWESRQDLATIPMTYDLWPICHSGWLMDGWMDDWQMTIDGLIDDGDEENHLSVIRLGQKVRLKFF